MAERDLEYYLDHPDEMPADFAGLGATGSGDLGELDSTGDEPGDGQAGTSGKADEQGAPSGATAGEKSVPGSEAQGAGNGAQAQAGEAGQAEAQQQVLLARDGKSQIPYSVLQTEREQRRAAEQAVEQLRQQVEQLTARVNAAPAPAGTPPAAEAKQETRVSEQDIEDIAKDFPAAGNVLKSLMGTVQRLETELSTVRESEGQRRQNEARTASTSVQEAIDNNGTLTFWQQQDPDMFKVAVQFDNQIKADPRNRGLSLDERFAKVVKAVEAVYGETQLPEAFRPAPAAAPAAAPAVAAPAAAPASKQTPQSVAARAEKAIADAQGQPPVQTLSDIPGGVPPEADELSQLAQLSASDLGNKFMKMDLAQVQALLSRAA